MIELVVDTTTPPMSWDEFVVAKPPFSIALDGYVSGPPRFDPVRRKHNFNHHEEVDRLATLATCGQVLLAVRMGLFDIFRDSSGARATIFVNDADQDVCLSVYLLTHFYLHQDTMDPRLNRLVNVAQLLDATAGAYSFPKDLPLLRELGWIFQPYTILRTNGGVDRRDPEEFRSVIEQVGERVAMYVAGTNKALLAMDLTYRLIDRGADWWLVTDEGQHGRTAMYADGCKAFVSYRERPDGRWSYVLGRMSSYVPFPVTEILAASNQAEGCQQDRWGGSPTAAGSPRVNGSGLRPSEFKEIVDTEVRRYKESVFGTA